MEHDEQAEHMEEEADRMEHHSDQLGERIEDVQRDWERKEEDVSVPGAQPDPDEEEEPDPGVASDEETLSEEGGP